MKVEDIKYDDNDKTIESIRLYKQQMESQNLTQEQQDLLISKLVADMVGILDKTLTKEMNELDEFIAKYNFLLAVGKITDAEFKRFGATYDQIAANQEAIDTLKLSGKKAFMRSVADEVHFTDKLAEADEEYQKNKEGG